VHECKPLTVGSITGVSRAMVVRQKKAAGRAVADCSYGTVYRCYRTRTHSPRPSSLAWPS